MRITRVAATRRLRHPLISRIRKPEPVLPAVNQSVETGSSVLPRATVILPPTEDSPHHPMVSNSEHGWFKYTTGLQSIPPHARRLNGDSYAWKVFTAKPVLHDYHTPLADAVLHTSIYTAPKTLRSAFHSACVSAFEAFRIFKHVRQVFFQNIGYSAPPGRRKVLNLPGGDRWNRSLKIYRPYAEAPLSRPWLSLGSPRFLIGKHCAVDFGDVRHRAQALLALTVRVEGHVKSAVYNAESTMSETSGLEFCGKDEDPNQSLMRNMSSAIITGLRGKRFRSANECVMESEADVLRFLQKSPLSALIDFHCVLLELSCDGYERTSHSRLLNPDGTPMYPLDTTMLSSTPVSEADPGNGTGLPSITTGVTLLLSDHTSKTVTSPNRSSDVMSTLSFETIDATVLSHIAEAKLGVKTLGIPNGHDRSDESTLGRASDVPTIIQELEQFCETTNETGLKCCLSAVLHLRTRLPRARNPGLRSNVISFASICTTKGETPPQVQLVLAPYDLQPSRPTVHLRITSLPSMSVTTQQDSKPRSTTIRGLYVDICPPRPDQHAGGSPILHTNSPLAEDILRVVETVYRVIDRLSNGVTFAEQASVPARLSEAIFRVLRTETCPGEVMKVVVQLEEAPVVEHPPLSTNSRPSVDSSTSAGLRTSIDPHMRAGNVLTGVTRTDGDSLTPPAVTPVETDWWAINGMSSMGPTQFKAALASVQPGVLQGTGGRGVSLLHHGGIVITVALKFPELFDAAGLSALQIQVTWSPVSAFGALGFNAERIEDMCQMSAMNYAGRGFDTLRTLVDELIASLPEQPHVHLLARIGRSSNNTPSVAPYTTPRLARVSIAVSERSSAKDLPVKFMLPRIYGFVVPERPTECFVEVILTGRLPCRPDLTGTVDMDVAAANSVKAVIESAAPIFSALGSAALDDHLAGRIASSLLHAEAVFPHRIRPEGVDVRIGTAEGAAPSTGTASVSVARVIQSRSSNDPPPPSLPPGIDTFGLQAETIPTGSQSHQEEAEDANDSTEPPSEAVSQRETPPSREGEEVLVPAGFKVHIPPILS
ncbi:trifunctional dihydropteroate synthetase [Friedmanniomyces endolithicus]|nr:trifunctional dihydropteroate synthetase [Friedmanniomyces endolithicus]